MPQRPKKPRKTWLKIRCSEDNRKRWINAAKRSGVKLDDWITEVLNREILT